MKATACLLLCAAAAAPAQVVPNRTTAYLHPADVTDARALWVNPAGLGRVHEASLHLDVTVGDPGVAGRLRQLTLGLSSRGFMFGYQRDIFGGGGRGHTYRVGFAGGHRGLAAGAAITMYRGSTKGSGWDLGVLYDLGQSLSVGGVLANIGQPVVRDSLQPFTTIPGATLRLFGSRAALSAHGRLTSDAVLGYAFGLRAGVREGSALAVRLLARLETDRSLRRTGLAFGLSVGGGDLLGIVATTPGDVGRIDALSLYAVSTRRLGR